VSDSSPVSIELQKAVLEATLKERGGEPLEGSGFEQEDSIDLDEEPAEGEAQ
jgi:hypothetical protein